MLNLNLNIKMIDVSSVKEYFTTLGILNVYGLHVLEALVDVREAAHNLQTLGFNHSYAS